MNDFCFLRKSQNPRAQTQCPKPNPHKLFPNRLELSVALLNTCGEAGASPGRSVPRRMGVGMGRWREAGDKQAIGFRLVLTASPQFKIVEKG
jgi:hypothetical protein